MIRDIVRSPLLDVNLNPLGAFLPSDIANLKLWTRFNQGITITGSGVSQWDDVSGNGNHLKQGTDTNRPSKEADGSILFDGVDNFLKADAFTLVQPETIYLLVNPITWTLSDTIFDGNVVNGGKLIQTGTTPEVQSYAGAVGASNTDLTLGSYAAVAVIFDQANSLTLIQVGNNTPTTDTAFGTNNMGGFTLGTRGDSAGNFANIQVKEVLVYSDPHDASQISQVLNYLSRI